MLLLSLLSWCLHWSNWTAQPWNMYHFLLYLHPKMRACMPCAWDNVDASVLRACMHARLWQCVCVYEMSLARVRVSPAARSFLLTSHAWMLRLELERPTALHCSHCTHACMHAYMAPSLKPTMEEEPCQQQLSYHGKAQPTKIKTYTKASEWIKARKWDRSQEETGYLWL